ncbi:MAG TPA: RHS repeat-associated core domain-containing protein [Sumerlaeia bacterium]|nr:RHS repeat-associated core domain-containing protein [Sumerlaeia bacterium]
MRWQYSYDDSNAGRLTAIASSNDDGLSAGETTSQYYQYDHRGNVVAVTDSSGDIQYGYQYDAFGNIMFSFDEGAAAAPTDDILFTGKDLDEDTGLYYFNARWYDAGDGRFVSQGPLTPNKEMPYLICDDNPVNSADPTGLFSPYGCAISAFCLAALAVLFGMCDSACGNIWDTRQVCENGRWHSQVYDTGQKDWGCVRQCISDGMSGLLRMICLASVIVCLDLQYDHPHPGRGCPDYHYHWGSNPSGHHPIWHIGGKGNWW